MNSFAIILPLCFLILFFTPTLAQTKPNSDSELPPKLIPSSTSVSPQLKPESVSNSTSSHEKITPDSNTKPSLDSKPTSTEPVSNSTSPHEKLTPDSHTKPTVDSKSTSIEPLPNSTSPHKKPESISNSTSSHTKPTLDSRSTSPGPVSTSKSPHTEPTPESHKKPISNSGSTSTEPASNSTSPHNPQTKPTVDSNSTLPHTGPKLEPNSTSPLTKTPPNSNKAPPHGKEIPHSKSTPSVQGESKPRPPKSKSNPKSPAAPKTKPKNTTSPYQFANHFCLGRRLDVTATFCLQILRSSAVSTKAEDNQALLAIAADAAIKFGRSNIALLKKLTNGRKARQPDLNTAVVECAAAYDGYIKQFQTLVEEAAVEAQLASYDSELAKLEIGRCIRALKGSKNADIEAANKAALEYARLAQNIADSIQ